MSVVYNRAVIHLIYFSKRSPTGKRDSFIHSLKIRMRRKVPNLSFLCRILSRSFVGRVWARDYFGYTIRNGKAWVRGYLLYVSPSCLRFAWEVESKFESLKILLNRYITQTPSFPVRDTESDRAGVGWVWLARLIHYVYSEPLYN